MLRTTDLTRKTSHRLPAGTDWSMGACTLSGSQPADFYRSDGIAEKILVDTGISHHLLASYRISCGTNDQSPRWCPHLGPRERYTTMPSCAWSEGNASPTLINTKSWLLSRVYLYLIIHKSLEIGQRYTCHL